MDKKMFGIGLVMISLEIIGVLLFALMQTIDIPQLSLNNWIALVVFGLFNITAFMLTIWGSFRK